MADGGGDEEIIRKADELEEAAEWHKQREFLAAHLDSSNPDVLWRVCRAIENVLGFPDVKKDAKKKMAYESFECAKKALELGPENSNCHQMYAVALSEIGEFEGSKAMINNLPTIKEHFQKAVELNPEDAMSHYLLGMWCFGVTDLSWIERKLASTLFGAPPKSTFEEALESFKSGEEKKPGFYCDNRMMLGKTHMKLGHKDEAREWLKKALECPVRHPDDQKSQDEAKKLLRSL
ncbi:regulator of microtubule dynamics protein 1-like [Corticium candelabrum]|uniref:regulator of microtubule dynamics protein 1-like n=1 Tax=Corticium candelabrum TaxID=121492 RepID=UPI002E270046|nr:regulator of microtubule dynamics protein 1-like [Corticium candelabrum]